MFVIYFPAFAFGVWHFINGESSYSKIVSATLAIHFGKRVFEVCIGNTIIHLNFIHLIVPNMFYARSRYSFTNTVVE
jgi:hypothetical protein